MLEKDNIQKPFSGIAPTKNEFFIEDSLNWVTFRVYIVWNRWTDNVGG